MPDPRWNILYGLFPLTFFAMAAWQERGNGTKLALLSSATLLCCGLSIYLYSVSF